MIHCASQFAQKLEEFRNVSGKMKVASRILNQQLTIVEKLQKNFQEFLKNDYQVN